MKPNDKAPVYTAKEVVEILEKAKALGCIHIKLAGFEAAWEFPREERAATPQAGPALPERDDNVEAPRSNGEAHCETCREQLTQGEYGLYCRGCYIRRKEARFQKDRKWQR